MRCLRQKTLDVERSYQLLSGREREVYRYFQVPNDGDTAPEPPNRNLPRIRSGLCKCDYTLENDRQQGPSLNLLSDSAQQPRCSDLTQVYVNSHPEAPFDLPKIRQYASYE